MTLISRPRIDVPDAPQRISTRPPQRTAPRSGNYTTSEWLAWVRAQTLNGTGEDADKRQLPCVADREAVRLVYGEERLGARVLNVVPSGANVLVQCLWSLGGDSVVSVTYNDVALPPSFSVTNYPNGGTDAAFVAAMAAVGITYNDTLAGYSYSVITMPQAVFTGFGFAAVVRGRRVYDPRKDSTMPGGSGAHRLANSATWEYSTNPSLCDADYLYSPDYGCGKVVDWATVMIAADENDALVGGQKRRILDGLTIPGMQPVISVSDTLRTYAGCFHLPGPNGVKLLPDRPASSVASYSHTAGQIADLTRLEKKDMGNTPTVVEVTYTDRSATPWRDRQVVAQLDGVGTGLLPYRLQQIRLPGIQRHEQANREAIERLNKLTTSDLNLVLDVFDIGIAHELGNVITIADHPIGLTSKMMRIADAPEAVGKGMWRLPCAEYDPAVYNDSVVSGPTYPDTYVGQPPPLPPSNFTVAVQADGTRKFTVTLSGAVTSAHGIEIRYVTGSSSTWSAMSRLQYLSCIAGKTVYEFETVLPATGTWSFGAKVIDPVGTESSTAAYIVAAALGQHPVVFGAKANLCPDSDWSQDIGWGSGAYSDTRSLPGWVRNDGGSGAQCGRNYAGGGYWNVGIGGAWMVKGGGGTGAGTYAYIARELPAIAGVYYEASIYASIHNCNAYFYLRFVNAARSQSSDAGGGPDIIDAGTGILGDPYEIGTRPRLWRFGRSPAVANGDAFDTAYIQLICVQVENNTNAGYTFWHRLMLCPHGAVITKENATPWIDNAPPITNGGTIPRGTVTDIVTSNPANSSQVVSGFKPYPAPDIYGGGHDIVSISWTNNTAATVDAQVGFFFEGYSTSLAELTLTVPITLNGSFVSGTPFKSVAVDTRYHEIGGVYVLSVPAGQQVVAKLRISCTAAGVANPPPEPWSSTLYWRNAMINIQGIRK